VHCQLCEVCLIPDTLPGIFALNEFLCFGKSRINILLGASAANAEIQDKLRSAAIKVFSF
jgi:hypothetical protein